MHRINVSKIDQIKVFNMFLIYKSVGVDLDKRLNTFLNFIWKLSKDVITLKYYTISHI